MKIISYTVLVIMFMIACNDEKRKYSHIDEYPTPLNENLWLEHSNAYTIFKIWSPIAEKVKVNLYEDGNGKAAKATHQLLAKENGIWEIKLDGNHSGTYYTYQIFYNNEWLSETPGMYAQAVGVNGKRAMVLDMETTNPENWNSDKSPNLNSPNEAIIYEMHVRDFSIDSQSGIFNKGKYLGLTETGAKHLSGVSSGLDHIKEMGITHVHLLPAFDFATVDETKLDSSQYNWGYDPQNYNVPEGSYATNPYNAKVRIKEFKQMVQAFHNNDIGVILDVVYNHTSNVEDSNFNLEVPGYFYRSWEDGSLSNASGCGNETASDRAMMRKFIIESVCYWAKEYHIDGFRFDLMGIHDIETMNVVAKALRNINPQILIYGEGWTAGDSPLAEEKRALKSKMKEMPQISAFCDDVRDGLKGSVFDDKSTGFVSGAKDMEESILFGLVGCIEHPQIDYSKVNYSKAPWTNEPWQSISYVSCHDNHTLYDKLKISRPDADETTIKAMHKLANAIVLTSQGTTFLHAGTEMLRTKNGEHNSYNLPDNINQINWSRKSDQIDVVNYYKNLIKLRKAHPAFRMHKADDVRANLSIINNKNGIVSYQLNNNANGDKWKNIQVIYNANPSKIKFELDGIWNVAVVGDNFDLNKQVNQSIVVPAISMVVLYQE
jgi:pullulanase